MKRPLTVAVLCLAGAGSGWSLDAESQRLADRYRALVVENPAQKTAFDRLWKIYADAGETEVLVTLAREQAREAPAFYARVLLAAGRDEEARKFLDQAAATGSLPAAEMLSGLLETQGEFAAAARMLEQAGNGKKLPALLVRQGELWAKAGDEAKARAVWEEAVVLAPDDLALRKKLAAADRTGSSAVGHLRVIAEKGSPTERFEAWEEISRRQEEAGELTDALAAQESLLALMGPGHWKLAAARRRLFTLHERNGTLADLQKTWEAEAGERPRDPDPILRLAQLHEFRGDEAGGLIWLRRAAELLPRDLTLATRVAALELAQGHPEEAARLYDQVLAENPGAEDVIFLRAEIDALAGREDEAEKRVGDFLAGRPDDAAATARVQEFYRRLRLAKPLERALRETVSARPADLSARRELVRFYLEERRFAEAVVALEQIDDSSLEPREFATAAVGFSEMLHQAGLADEALDWGRKAVAREPADADFALHLADLLAATDRAAEVPDVLEAACQAAAPALPREDLDRRLFLALQAAGPDETALLPDSSKRVREKIAVLQESAPGAGETGWRRLARWRRWHEGGAGAAEALREGLKISDSPVLREELAVALAEAGDSPSAIAEYRLLLDLQPEKARTWQRQIGHLQLDMGAVDEGLATFEALAAGRDDDWQAVADLALAEQRAGNWFQALETWQRASRLAPPDARAGLIPPVLNAAARLQLAVRGLDFLEELAGGERDLRTREDLLREAARFAKNHQATAEWRDRLERRLEAAPQDRSWRMGLVFLLEEEGRAAEAKQVLADARPSEADSVGDLQEAADVAEKAEDWDETARLLKRLSALENPPSSATATRLAEILERAGRREEAREAWDVVVRRHARSAEALTAAAEFFDRIGDDERMETSYRAAAQFGGCPPQVLLRLGRLALERGDRMQALDDFEGVLDTTRPDPGFSQDAMPLPERILSTKEPAGPAVSFLPSGHRTQVRPAVPWQRAGESETGGCRLLAIREAAQLLSNSPDKTRWLDQFSTPLESIWASYYSGEIPRAFGRMQEEANSEQATASLQQSYAALAMENGREPELAAWAEADPESSGERWDHVLAAFSRMLEAGWRPSEEAVQRLFATAPPLKRWQVARTLAGRQQFREAVRLGQTVPAALKPSQATPAWLEVSKWNLDRREVPAALTCLDQAVAAAAPAVSYADPYFAAVRARWLLTPPEQRADFEKSLAARWSAPGHPACAAAGRALLASLNDRPDDAAREVKRLFTELGNSEEEGWAEVVQRGGAQLEEWNLHRLARDLYREDLARDPALQILRGENFRRATEALWIFNRLGTAREESAGYLLNEWLARGVTDEELLQATARLQQIGRTTMAARAFEILCDRNPGDASVVTGLINLAGLPAMRPAAMRFLDRFLARPATPPHTALWDNAALRLAAFWEEDGEAARALALLERLSADRPDRTAQLVAALCRMGRFREALRQVENHPQDLLPVHQQMDAFFQAELYAAFGRDREARALREKAAARPGGEKRRAYPSVFPLPPRPAEEWIELLGEMDARPMSPEERFRAGRDFLLTHRGLPADLQTRELGRLQKLAGRDDSLRPDFHLLRRDLATSPEAAQALEADWLAEWNSGQGSYLAGEMLVQRYLAQKRFEDLAVLLGPLLTDRHFHEQAWNHIGQRLLEAGQPALAVRVFSALMARAPGDTHRALDLSVGLWKSGRRAIAREILAPVARIAAVDPQKHADLARFYLRVDEPGEALPHLRAAESRLRGDPGLGGLWAAAARSFLAVGQVAGARDALTRAARGPQTLPAQTVGDLYEAEGNFPPAKNDFDLPPRLWREVQVDVLQRLLGSGDLPTAWLWLENHPALMQDPRARSVLQALEGGDFPRAGKIWNVALQSPLWEMQTEAAQFFLRRAQAVPASALEDLDRAHRLNPGSFFIAKCYAEELLKQDKTAKAQSVLQDVLSGYALPADRLAAREMLVRLQASPALPNKG